MKESRRHSRTLSFRTGTLRSSGLTEPIVCMILNASDTGLCLLVNDPAVVPANFTLTADYDHAVCECETVWRGRHRVGARFVARPETDSPAQTAVEGRP
jgi:hypothetical protein